MQRRNDMEKIEFRDEVETLIDIATTVGAMAAQGKVSENSRDIPALLVEWANAFNERHAHTDWADVEYLETVRAFASEQLLTRRAARIARNKGRSAQLLQVIETLAKNPGPHPEVAFAYVTGRRDMLEDLLGPEDFEELWTESGACTHFHELRAQVTNSPAVSAVTGYVPRPD